MNYRRPDKTTRKSALATGFTLIELSIVVVIIGLIAGGVLVGQDLIRAAAVRAQISQIEKFSTAVNTFRGKYGYLPGDMNAVTASQLGFATRAGTPGRGDGNGVIEGYYYQGGILYGWDQLGEPAFFWEDLSAAGLIEGRVNTAIDGPPAGPITPMDVWMPSAKIGRDNYVYVYSNTNDGADVAANGVNYFGLSGISTMSIAGNITSVPAINESEALAIDGKIDDGLPISGRVRGFYDKGSGVPAIIPAPNAGSGSSSTCYDTTSKRYSLNQNGGAGVNCALSFQFQ